jgi:hypothetical protein
LQILEQAKRLRLVILDACRDNPFLRMRRTVAGRSIGRGLAKVEVLTSDTAIAFAAKAGSTAADGDGANSPYTTALIRHLATPGLDLRLAFGRVRDEVLKSTSNKQEPFLYGSLGGVEITLVAAPPTPAPTATTPPAPSYSAAAEAARVCREVGAISSLSVLNVLANQHKGTPAGDCVVARIGELKEQQQVAVAAPPPQSAPGAPTQLVQSLQNELKRVGCDPGPVNGAWGSKTKQALGEFIRLTKISIPSEEPTEDALNAVRERKGRICPLLCRAGEVESGGRCVAKAASEPKQKATPRANDEKGGSQSEPMCWANGVFGLMVPCSDGRSSGKRAF